MMNENQIETKVCNYAKQKGWTVRKYVTPGHNGALDRIFRKKHGLVFWIEFKSKTGVLSKLQELELSNLRADGFRAYVVSSVEEGMRIVDEESAR